MEDNKDKVINDLLKRVSNLEFDVESKEKENERLNNIIKEAREYINRYETIRGYYEYEENGYDEYNYEEDLKQELLEILDKANDREDK